ncbi:obscurin isoform X3 [Pieris napi]|uniref:obscurin isoform X3 n=1 Tax=Pieris napi TaxID=78633 RepID=UPI001FBA86C3|nr:obscurin isoform X3 [Pieris napi]
MSFCRITGRSRGLPKPNYFPLLAPISPADAKRCCRITGKSYGLPSHHYIPVLLASRSGKTKCKITNVSGELGPHHYSPEINYGNRKHDVLPGYRYIFPVLDGSTEAQKALIEMLSMKQITEDKKYVYTVDERRCSLVFCARMEAAVRDGDVRDVMLAKDSDTVLIKTKQGRNVSMDFKEFAEDVEMFEGEGPNAEVLRQREKEEIEEKKKKRKRAAALSSMKKIFENKEKLAEVQEIEEDKLKQDRMAKKAKLEVRHEKHDLKSVSYNNFDLEHMRSKSSMIMCNGDWRDQVHPLIESFDWDLFDKHINEDSYCPKVNVLPTPLQIIPYHCEAEIYQVDNNISENSVSLENVPCINPLKPIKSRPSEEIINAIKEIAHDRLTETLNVTEKMLLANKMDMIPNLEDLPEIVKHIKKGKREKVAKVPGLTLDINKAKKFVPGQHVNTPQGPVFIAGQTVETPSGPVFVPGLSVNTPLGVNLIPGHIIQNENNNESVFLAGQIIPTPEGDKFVCGQVIKNKDNSYRFTEGQTVLTEEGFKFVPGKTIHTCSEDVFVPGQTLSSPDGIQFIPGQTSTENGDIVFTPGQNAKIDNEWQFVPGQVVHKDNESHFVPGATLATPNGLKFIPGQTVSVNGEPCFVPGITRKDESGLKFIPGTNVDTPDGPKFLEGQIIQTNFGEKFVPGKTITLGNGNVEFSIAKSIEDVQFSDSMPIGLPINIKTCSVSEESLYVFGHMVQTSKGIEFYPGSRVPKNEGKVVPGRLVKNDVGESRFVPGTMVEGIFVPGQIVFTENGEQFVPGQVVDTSDGPKFVPGQVVNTKSGPKFVPGQTIHTIDGPRFVPGQIIETKAGPTFIPGQVISTDEGSRFVPGQVVDTEEGPRFVPGRVIENDDNGVTFVPGQIVQTPEGLKFVAPDLIEGDEGLEFSVQSFLVTPEELKLLKVKTNPNDTTSTKGELTIDTNMLKQLSEAGMSIGRQVPAELPAINVILNETKNAEALKEFALDFGLKDTVANQLMDVIKSIIEMSVHLKTEIGQNANNNGIVKTEKSHKSRNIENSKENESTSEEKAHEENIKNSIAAAVLAALVTAEQFQEINNNNGKEKYQQILKSIDTILGKTIDEDFVTAMYNILQKDDEKEILCDEILENTTKPKLELIRIAVNRSSENHSFTEKEIVDKFSDFLKSENEVLGPAFKNITKTDTNLLHHVLGHISDMISFVKSEQDAAESLQKAIVSAVQETSSQTIINMLQDTDPEQKELKELIKQSIGLARVLGMSDVAKHLLCVLKDDTSLSQIANDDISMNILKRLTVMRKLAEQTPDLHEALVLLGKCPESARTDPKLRELVRESAALMIIPEEAPLLTSADVPLSLLQPENSLAMEDFLFKRKKCSGALLIMKKGLQAVVPREASRAVLTGEIAYTVLDENGIKYFEPLHVFSALNLSQPIAHRFSMYSCPIADEKDDDLQNYNGYCNISNSQITTRLGLGRRYSNANPDRETTRNRIHNYDYTPSYKRYQSRSSTRSRSTCSKSPPKVDDVVVATSDYTAVADDEVSVKAGDIVEVLDTKTALGSKCRLDKELDVEVELLDSSAARHKIAVRPKKNHPKVKAAPKQNGERWLVRVLEDVQGDELSSRQGYVPAHVLREKEPERDMTALAARRQAVIRELIETEEEFGRDMQQVVSQYMRPMDKTTTPKPVFESREFLFSNFKQICEFHNTSLLEGIKYYAADPRMLGRALLRMEREFDKHVAYCRDEPKAQQLLSAHPVIKKYFQEIAKKVGDDKGLAEHLKLPIQRINDYQLLLKELVKYSKRLGDESTDLQKALELFLGVPNRATNNLFIASIEGFRGNIYKLGRLLTHDWFTVEVEGTKENLYLFLFKARILISKIKRVADDRSVFVLQQIIRIPDIEIKDHPESLKFELHQKDPPLIFILKAQKEQVKTAWLREIRQYASDLVALAEHAADDLQVLPQEDLYKEEDSPEIQEETKKRERSEEVTEYSKEKKSRVEESEENKEESQIPTKRKASLESDIATKLSKSEIVEATSEFQETLSTTQDIVTVDLESKSVVTQESTQVSEVQSITSQSQTSQEIIQEEFVEAALQEVSASKEVSTTQTVQVHCTEVFAQGSVQEVVETACKTQKSETTVEASQDNVVSVSQQSIEKLESLSVEEARLETEIKSDSPNNRPDETAKKDSLIAVSRQTSKASKTSEETSVQISSGENVVTKKEDVSEQTSEVVETSKAEQKRPSKTKRESKKKTESVDYSEEEKDVTQIKSSQETVSVTKQTDQAQESLEVNVIDTSNQIPSSEKVTELPEKEKTFESVSEEFTKQKDNTEVASKESALDTNSAITSEDKVVTKSQTVESEETGEEMSSRYSRSSRLSGEYSSSTRKSSTGGRYESSDGTGISTYSRRESGSRLESSRIDLGSSIEGSAASKYESKYSTSAIDNGSKYGVESSFESRSSIKDGSRHGVESTYESRRSIKDGSKYGIESGYEGNNSTKDSIESSYESRRSIKDRSKYDRTNSIKDEYGVESSYESRRSIKDASKYGVDSSFDKSIKSSALESSYERSNSIKESKYSEESEVESKIDSIAAKYGLNNNIETKSTKVIEAGYDVEMDAPSKIDSIASKYGRNSITESSKSKTRSTRLNIESSVDGNNVEAESQFESKRQSKANGRTVYEEEFSKNALLNGSVTSEYESKKSVSKSDSFDGRPIFTKTLEGQNIELTPEERKQKNALNAPYFIVALKDTEILLNTYLRFMVKVKGNPNPDVKFYREGKEITTCLDSDRVSIVRTRAERGCYELVISDVNVADAGKYSCKAINIYGDVESECTVAVVDDKNIFGELPPGGEGLLAKGEKPVFAWKRDGLEFDPEERFKVLLGDDEDSLALVFQHVKPEDAGMYTCVAKTSTGNISCSAELTVQGAVNYLHREPEKPTLEIEHREAVVSSGGSAMLELVCKGYPKPTVVWKHKGDVVEADARHKFLHEDDENMSLVIKNVTSADSGVYEVTASNDLGDDTTSFNLVVTAPPKIKKKIENQTCMVETSHTVRIEVEGTPAPEVSFYKDGVLITSSDRIIITKESDEVYTITIKDAKLTDSGSYSIVAKNEVNQCSDFWQWHVTSPPKVIKKLGESKVCEEKETVTFEVKTEAEPAPTVTWFKNKTELKESSAIKISSSGEAHKLVITSAARADAGEYSCEIRNVHGSTSDSCLLNVRCGPVFTQRLKDTTSSEGDVNVEFTVDVEAYPEPKVQWYLGDVEITEKKSVYSRIDNGSTHKLILKEVSAEMSGQYSCRVTNDLGADSCQATFTVNRKPRITKSLIDMTVDEGQTLKLEVEVEGCPEPKVKWYKDGKEVNTDARIKIERDTKRLENYNLTVTLVKEEDGGEYEVRAENEMGSVSCKSTVTVHTKEVHSRFTKETLTENELDADCAEKQKIVEDLLDDKVKKIATKEKSKSEVAEEKSVLDDDAKAKSVSFEEVDKPVSNKARKSLTEPENIEKKSVDDVSLRAVSVEEVESVAFKPKKSVTEPETLSENLINEQDNERRNSIVTDLEKPAKAKKSFTEPEVAEEKELLGDSNKSKCTTESVDEAKPYKAQKSVTEPEIVEEKSFWDDVDNDGKTKTSKVEKVESVPRKAKKSVTEPEVAEEKELLEDSNKSKCTTEIVDESKPYKAQKSVTEPEIVEEKSFWDDVDNDRVTKTKVEEVESVPRKAKKSITEPEVIETGSVIDENQNEVKKVIEEVGTTVQQAEKTVTKPEIIEEVEIKSPKRKSIKKQSTAEEPLSADTEGRVFETVTTFKSGDDGSITVSKVSSTRSHGAIITGPAETRTLHKMTTTAMHYDENDECDKKIIIPNKPHTTSLEVEEIASHSYFLSELGYFTIPDHIRRGTYGIIEEPQTDSDADSIPRMGRYGGNRTYSIRSASEDEMSWQNDSLSREISIEDLSKSLFEIDETKKVFSKDSYVRQTSFKEDYYTNEGEEEYVILKEKSEKVFERDVTEKLIDITKEFEDGEYMKFGSKKDNIKNRLIEELVLESPKNITNITKNIAETTVERKRKIDKSLFIVEEEDGNIEELLKRSQRQRSILDDILNSEEEKASPILKESSMKDGHTFESLPLVYTVEAVGKPKPTVRWLHNGEEVKPDKGIHLTNEGDVYKLAIDAVDLKDIGKWQCEISNKLGKQVLDAELAVSPVAEYRKPIFRQPLEAQRVMQREPVTLKAICTADPLPHVAWLLNGNEIVPDATVTTSADSKELEHGLKECIFTLQIPTGRHQDTGVYTIQAKNQYGIGECSARLDILLRPEIEGLKDVTTVPYEETTFVANIRANPIAEVKWSKDGYVIQPSANIEINEDLAKETYSLTIKKIGVADAGVYTVTAKNEIGETAQQAKLTVHTNEPQFTKPLQKQTVKDYDDVTLKVRCDGVPKPDVKWYKEGIELANDERRTITTEVGGQVDSELEIKHFNPSDAGKYKAVARNLSGEASTEAEISLAQVSPGFVHKLDRQKEVDEGEPLELKAKVDGSPIPTAQWFKDGVKLPADDHVKQVSLPDGTIKLSIDHVTPSDCGAYKLIITNPNGEHSALCAVAINPTPRKPSFSQELEDTKVMVGQPVKLEARVMAFPAPEVKWFKDGLPIRPSQAVNFINQPGGVIGLAIDACKPEDAGVYSLTLSNKLGEAASKASVEVAQKERKPAFIAELMPSKVIEGFPVKMEVKVLGHPQPIIKWTHNGKEIVPDGERVRIVAQPDGTHALLFSKATAEDAGKYGVVAINDKGETASTAELSVASRTDDTSPEERPQFLQSLREVTADEGQPLTLSAPFVGNPVPEVSWSKDGQDLKPNDRILLTCDGKRVGLEINPIEKPDAGVYSVKLVNPMGEDKTEGKVHVRKVFQPPAFTQKFTDLQQLPSFDAKFPARISGIPAPEVTWYKNGAPLSPSNKYQMKRDGDACCLYVRDLNEQDAGQYKCVAKNKEGQAECEAALEVVDKISRREKVEPPSFLKKIGDVEVFRGLSAKFTACATGTPDPDVEWFRNDEKLFPCERIRMDKESTGLLRLTISGVDPSDVGSYRCRIFNPHGEESCIAQLTYDTLEPQSNKKPISEQYSEFDKMKATGVPMPLADKPIISRMADRHLTLSWKPSIPHRPRFPVTYQVEMCEVPDGDWFTARTGLRSCVCDIRNLEPFRDYKFRVRVENKYGVSDPSPYAITHRAKLEPDPPKFVPYLEPGIDFRPETSPYFPKDFDIERPPHDGYAQAPKFLRQEYDSQYGVKGHNVNLFWFVYGYPKPKMTYYFNDEPIEVGGRYDWSYTRNGQAALFINKMLERDVGWYEAVATNEHGQARQRVRLELAEYPTFIRRPEESVVLVRKTARIVARVTGQPYPEIKWYKDWQPIAPSSRIKMHFKEPDTVVLVIHDVILKDEGLYSVSARNPAGAVSSSAMLHVEECEHEYSSRVRENPPRIKPSSKPFGDFYDIGDELGRGVQGVVYHAAERLSGRNYAAKIMHGHSDLKPFMKNELEIMNLLNDRHLVRLHDAYEHDHTLALVMELASGGELVRDRLLRSQGYTERDIAGYVRQLLRGLKHMHDNSIAHLGLTIGELLLSHVGSDELKICDFGLSRRIHLNQHAALNYGMPEFVAPEVAKGEGVAFGADMWSVGIITYILLSGRSPFRGLNDRETLSRVREGQWEWFDEEWWSRFSLESRDFISKLLVLDWRNRLDVDSALAHPWLSFADKIYKDEYIITTDRLRSYYNSYRDWMSNASCRTWFRRRPLEGAFDHPSRMVYPPGELYTPEGTPDRDRSSRERKSSPWDLKFKQWDHPDWEVSATSESHYQNGPDTYLLQLRDTQFPVRLREYMKVACHRSPAYNLSVHDSYDPRTPIIRERRRFTDVMDEEIDDERKERINQYGSESYTIRRLRHELGTRLDSYAEAQAFMESKKDGHLPFFREKPQILPVREGEPAQLSCYAVGDPKPVIQWFKNDMVIAEGQRIKIIEDDQGRSTLNFDPAMHHDIGFYKVVARNKVGQTVARTRIVEATTPNAPDSPAASEVSDTEVLLRWKQPKYDGNSPVVCYSLQFKEGDSVEWKTVAENIDHEFFVIRDLVPQTSYQFRLSSRNRIGWSEKGIPTTLVKTLEAGAPKIQVTKAMKHLQQMTESGQEIVLDEDRPKLDYATEEKSPEWGTTDQFTERYSFVSELWRGKFSIVVKGIDKTTDSVVVAKILECRPETEVQVQREFECLRRLRHERISNLFAAYQTPGSPVAALVLEKLQGADILTYLSSRHDYSEQVVATIITQVLDGLQYLHWRGYCHLDLQPDNVVLASVRSVQVKLVDFGSAHKVTKLGTIVPQVGELDYKAPEVINDEAAYPQTDIWSVGVLAYILLSGVSPFRGSDDAETKQNISFVRYRFEHLYKEITQEATRFLMFIFKKTPLKRPTAEECYEHRWLHNTDFMLRKRERAVFLGNRLKEFSEEYHSRKSAEASEADSVASAFPGLSPRMLARSNSIQDELMTNFTAP